MLFAGFHNRLNDGIGCVRPSLWFFINYLKDVQVTNERTARNAERGVPPPAKKRKWRVLDSRITRLKADYMSGRRSVVQYWSAMSHIVRSFI